MTNKEARIIELLKEGRSYTYIQKEVQVSPSKIAQIRKRHFAITSSESSSDGSTTDGISTTDDNSGDEIDNAALFHENENNSIINNQKTIVMSNEKTNDEVRKHINGSTELEKLRLQLEHEIALKKMQQEEQQISLQFREMRFKENSLADEHKKTEKAGKTLIFRFRKLMGKFVAGTWTYQELTDYNDKAKALRDEIEQYCFENDIETEGLEIFNILNKAIKRLQECIQRFDELDQEVNDEDEDEDEEQEECEPVIQIVIEPPTQKMLSRAQVIDFDEYEDSY